MTQPTPRRHNPHFLARGGDGKSRVRLTFEPEEVARMEQAAGARDVVAQIHTWIKEGVARELDRQRQARSGPVAPPPRGA